MTTRLASAATGIVLAAAVGLFSIDARSEPDYAGSESCVGCHEEHLAGWEETIHAKALGAANARTPLEMRGCESCHGPGMAHVEAGGGRSEGKLLAFGAADHEAISAENAACLSCHSKGKPMHWPGSPHESRDLACTSCHSVHEKKSERGQLSHANETELCGSCHVTQRAQTFRNQHMPVREGAMSCSSCHNAHGSVSEALIRHDTVNENCYSCHADKRGPFLWEHAPVSENCLNCHDPHGSTRRSMLKSDPPRLCQQCHVATRHPSQPRDSSNPRFVLSRSCAQCHSTIHGSNHPAGWRFMR